MKKTNIVIGQFLYAISFLLIMPIALWLWAKYTEHLIMYPAIESKTIGWIMIIVGSLLASLAMFYLMKYGRGLPMNAYPPPHFVENGPYRLFRHPIYLGFGVLMMGYFILSKSVSGQWLVTPITLLSMTALVLGYEQIDLKKRFPDKSVKTLLDLPKNSADPPGFRDYVVSLFRVLTILWLVNFLTSKVTGNTPAFIGVPLEINLGFDNQNLLVLSIFFIIVVPFLLRRKDYLREWVLSGIIAMCLSLFIALIIPSIGAQYLKSADLILLTVPIFLILISLRLIFKLSKKLVVLFVFVAVVLVIIQLTSCRSAVLNFTVSVFIFLLAAYYYQIWIFLKTSTEKIANSWKEWLFGKVRVINHGFYVGVGAFFGILLSGLLAGRDYAWAILIFAITVIVFSALWAQIIEGSEKLKRPYGFYGALVGILFAGLVVRALGYNVWVIIGVISVVMPWVQAIGRLRCLINGCCHGAKVDNPSIGIRYFHHRSRVYNISGMKGELLHPTPLYSILWLFLIGFILLSLWNNDFSSSFIFGLYLILTGIGRFVEEAYRGEVQTRIIKGLRLYQWTAILSVIIGIFMTSIQIDKLVIISDFGWEIIISAVLGGLFTTFAMGVDFPYSNARFSRLV
jgi:protein-S-isoprenylcysteine O-methyltransferase Ste14